MRAKDIIPAAKPRNFVAKNAMKTTSGARAQRDKKKEQKQGYEKHKGKEVSEGDVMEYETHRYTDDQGNEWEVNDEGERTLLRAAPGSGYGGGRRSSRYNRLPRYKPYSVPSQQKKGMYFYNVNDPQTAQKLGLRQSKSGKWYLPAGSLQKDTADKVFGAGKYWEPKN